MAAEFVVQVLKEGLQGCLQELQMHFYAPVSISMYSRELEASLRSQDNRPEHDMRDHDALRDACQFLLIAADILEEQLETIIRLLFNEVITCSAIEFGFVHIAPQFLNILEETLQTSSPSRLCKMCDTPRNPPIKSKPDMTY